MSSNFQEKNKILNGLQVVKANQAWVYNPKTGKYDKLNPKMDFYGKVDIRFPGVLKANKTKESKAVCIDDFCSLNLRTKTDLANTFINKDGNRTRTRVVYLARTDDKSKTDAAVKAQLKNKDSVNKKRQSKSKNKNSKQKYIAPKGV